MNRAVLGLLLVSFFHIGAAQEEETDTLQYDYPAVVVTAPRIMLPLKETPFSTSIVPPEILSNLPRSIAINEPLELVPGVKVDNQANGSRVHLSIRGQGILTERGIRGIKILLDGIPVNDPTGFAPDFFDVDFNTVDRIEVLRGPAASIYGGSASGGIIDIFTQSAPNSPLSGNASAEFGSNGFWKGFGQFGGNVNAVNYRISFSRTMGDGYRDHTHFSGNNLYAKAIYTPSDAVQLTPIFCWTDFYHENPEGITLAQFRQNDRQANPDAIPFNEYLQTNRTTFGLTGLMKIDEAQEIQFNGFTKRTLFTEANNRTFNHRTIMSPGTSVQYTLRSGQPDGHFRNRLSVGADVQWQTIDEHRADNLHSVEGDTIRSKERIEQKGVGLFAIDMLDIGGGWGLMACLRYDDIRNELSDLLKSPYDLTGNADFSRLTGRIGATFSPLRDITLYASWGQGFLPPATEELAQNPDHFGGFNTHLTFATSNSFEVGSRGVLKRVLQYEATVFHLTTENDFDRYRIPDPLRNQETFYRNAGSSRRYGLELYAKFSPARAVEVQLAYTYSHFTYTNSTPIQIMMDDPAILKYVRSGNWLPNSPRHQLALDLQYTLATGLTVGLGSEMLSRTYIDGANVESEAAEGCALVNGRISYAWEVRGIGGELRLQFRNITDKEYIAFTEPDPGGNAYQPGARREAFVGLRVRL